MPVMPFQINQARLRQLRTDKQMSAEAMALVLREKLGKPADAGNDRKAHAATSTYQKIERTGKTSVKTAQALADIFEVTLGAIKGDEPIDAFKRLQAMLGKKLPDPELDQLRQEHARLRKECPNLDPDEILNELAKDIGERLEAAQLSRDQNEFDELSKLLDTPVDELKKPIFVRGHWWVTTSHYDGFDGFVVSGVSVLQKELKRLMLEFPFVNLADRRLTITFSRRQLRYRLQVEVFGISRRPDWIEWVRCEPNGDVGLRWSQPSEWDDYYLRSELREFAFANANVVRDFDKTQTPRDPRKIFLRVTTRERIEENDWKVSGLVRINGDVEDLPEEMFKQWEEFGSLEYILLDRLQHGLKEFLHPHLQHYGAALWEVCSTRTITLTLNQLWRSPTHFPELRPARQYQIELMTLDKSGEETPSPWRTQDIESLTAVIKSWIPKPSQRPSDLGETPTTGLPAIRQ
jgi:hypothetical protein